MSAGQRKGRRVACLSPDAGLSCLRGCASGVAGLQRLPPGSSRPPRRKRRTRRRKKEKKKEKPAYEFSRLEMVPSDDSLLRNFVKPGHAVTASMSAVSNMADLRADVESEVTDLEGDADPDGRHAISPRDVAPAVLPKGQRKSLEFTFFMPHEVGENQHAVPAPQAAGRARRKRCLSELRGRRGRCRRYQYLFVVLSANPNAYGYLKQIESGAPGVQRTRWTRGPSCCITGSCCRP